MGAIFGRVKGGFTVDLGGASAFLPGSQVDIRPVRDVGPLMGKPQPFPILKMDRPRGNIVVSRRAVLEESRAEQRTELVGQLKEGEILDGVVKNITDYGAFVDLGGIDGLLHVTDMAWKRVNHPSEVLAVGRHVKVQIIKINPETQRISLGMKQLQADPWDGVEAKYPVGAKFTGRVTNITDYGAFVELEPGVEGLVHVSEMSWTKKNVHPGKIVSTCQEVEVMVLDVDPQKRRVCLGLKQAHGEPVGGLRRGPPDRHRGRGRGQEHHRVRPVRRPGRRHRRHGPPLRPRLEPAGRRGDRTTTARARWSRPRCSTSTSRRSASASASSSSPAIRSKQAMRYGKKGDSSPSPSPAITGRRHRGEVRRRRSPRLHPQVGPVARPQRAASRALRRRRPRRRQGHDHRQGHAPLSLSVKAREIDEEKEAMESSARPTPAPPSATSWAPRSVAGKARRTPKTRARSAVLRGLEACGAAAPHVFFVGTTKAYIHITVADAGSRRLDARGGLWHRDASSPPRATAAMTKSELVQRLAEANPHLYQRDVEVIVTAIFDQIASALARGDRVECAGSEPSRSSGVTPGWAVTRAPATA